jgi:hypothetical protein
MLLAITVGQLVVPIAIIMVVVALGLVAKAVASRYIKVGPDEIAVSQDGNTNIKMLIVKFKNVDFMFYKGEEKFFFQL